MNKSPITYNDLNLIRFLENGMHNIRINEPLYYSDKLADYANKGIIIPDWNIPVSEDMDADAFIQTLIDMERTEFWQKAEEAGIRTDLLREVGYEFDYLTDNMVWNASLYLDKHLSGWPLSSKSRELLVKMLTAFVPYYDIKEVIARAINYSRYSKEKATSLEEKFFDDHNDKHLKIHLKPEVALLFINEFEDELTSKRREILNLYGADFVALPEYKSFIHNRGALMIAHLRINEGKADWFESNVQMMAMYKMLYKGKSFTIQSNIIKAERVAIESNTASMIAKLIQEHFTDLWNKMYDDENYWYREIARISLRCSCEYTEHEYHWRNEDDEIQDKLNRLEKWLKKKEQLYRNAPTNQAFYYSAYSLIKWPDKKIDGKKYNITDRCIFLYRLAHVCGFDKVGETLDLKRHETRKMITDRIKPMIHKISKIDTNGELDKMLYFTQELV